MRYPFFSRSWLGLMLLVGASALAASTPAAEKTAAKEIRVMSFNVRYSKAVDGENAWPKRTTIFFRTIEAFGPDLVGFQEVLADQHDALVAQLPGYGFSGVGRDDGQRAGEFSCLAYRKERFALLDSGNFWLSETPTVAGSKSWDAALTRICSWTRLRELATGREFVFANTHFDHVGKIARTESSRLISKRVTELVGERPAILTGDFNLTEDTPGYAQLVRPAEAGALHWIDSYRTIHPERQTDEASAHSFKGTVKGSRIDYIFHTAHFRAKAAEIVRTSYDGRYPSDHYPVTAVLEFR